MPKTKTCWCSLLACCLEIDGFWAALWALPWEGQLGIETKNHLKRWLHGLHLETPIDTNFRSCFSYCEEWSSFCCVKIVKGYTDISTICFNFQIHLLKCHLWCPTSNIHQFTSLRPQTSQHAYCVLPYGSGIHAHDTTNIKEERTHLMNLFIVEINKHQLFKIGEDTVTLDPQMFLLAQKTNLVTVELQLHRHPRDLEEKNQVPSKIFGKRGLFFATLFLQNTQGTEKKHVAVVLRCQYHVDDVGHLEGHFVHIYIIYIYHFTKAMA